jgi:geranylgeranyl diphosphate synthase type II
LINNIETILKEYKIVIDNNLETLIPKEHKYIKTLYEAARYSLFAGGKRLRPILAILSYRLFHENVDKLLNMACAIEMIHTYSLIHDDLPCMDNDDYRRGKLTNHKVYGDAEALLCGDTLLNMAGEVMIAEVLERADNLNEMQKYAAAMKEVLKASGTEGMIGGQFVDIKSENVKVDRDTLEYIHRNKTGAIIVASLKLGAIIAGASSKEVEMISQYGEKIGLAFQIQDDILDIIGDGSKLGKPIGSDEKNSKSTFVAIYGLERSKHMVQEITEEAVQLISKFERSQELIDFATYLTKREY